ncbi:hypothetical protein QBC37DRAFT_163755 [Rhypophila decipiens]|uniref:Uncharacterized protein n=1 Tax=Rhypophila decipiens TaxID=261697 RepID=A0AAN6Y7Y0_9PEZI|nr:hypothetical protein QBC37DRAFT_163755 [Rhypophila decipiens]
MKLQGRRAGGGVSWRLVSLGFFFFLYFFFNILPSVLSCSLYMGSFPVIISHLFSHGYLVLSFLPVRPSVRPSWKRSGRAVFLLYFYCWSTLSSIAMFQRGLFGSCFCCLVLAEMLRGRSGNVNEGTAGSPNEKGNALEI